MRGDQTIVANCPCVSAIRKSALDNALPTSDKKALAFTIGPGAQGPEKNDTFTGPGTYANIGIFIKPEGGDALFGYGQVVVADGGHSCTFTFKAPGSPDDDGDNEIIASGSWDCGRKLKH